MEQELFINLVRSDENLPYYIWTHTFNTHFLNIIDKCHNRKNNLKILSLPEIQPPILFGGESYSDYFNNWNDTEVDVIYSGFGDFNYTSERDFYLNRDLYRHLNPKRHFFALFFLYNTFNNYQWVYPNPPKFNYTCKFHFTTYNRRTRPHRLYILQLMKNEGLLENNLYTCFDYSGFNRYEFSWFTRPYFDFNNFNVRPNYLDDSEKINSGNYWHIFQSFTDSSFQAITETVTEPIFLTEKTFIPILNKKPFIIYGAESINISLTEFGFKLYDEVFNYSFDSIKDKNIRAQEYVKEIKRVCGEYTPTEIYEKLKPTAEYNYRNAIEIMKEKKYIPEIFLKWEEEHRNNNVWRNHQSRWYYEFEHYLENY